MHTVELYSKENCRLCDEAKEMLQRLQKKLNFELKEILLTENDPKAKEYQTLVPVVIVDGQHQFNGRISEKDLLTILKFVPNPTPLFYLAKFFEALGLLTVLFGFIYGVLGDMWTDLYFFLGGLGVFGLGWILERLSRKRVEKRQSPDDEKQTAISSV